MAERRQSRAQLARNQLGGAISQDRAGDHTEKRWNLEVAKLEDAAQAVADAWPDLREETLSRVAVLFTPAAAEPGDGPAAA